MVINDLLIKFFLTFILSLLFGIERQRRHKPIGFGTFIFVATGSCALAFTAMEIGPEKGLPLLGAIVTGIGFLGAGALIKTTDKIFGFTSAASIWLFAIFGLLIGIGAFLAGFLLYGTIWLVNLIDVFLEKKGKGSYQKKIIIKTNRIVEQKEVDEIIGSSKPKMISLEFNKKNSSLVLTYLIQGKKEDLNHIPRFLSKTDWFESFQME